MPPRRSRRAVCGRVLGDPQVLLLTLSYLVMNFVFYLVTFWSFLYLVQERKLSVLESGWLAALPFVVAGIASATGGRIADRLRQRFGDRTGPRILPLVTLPLAAVFLYLTVSVASPYWAIAALCLGFACVEVERGQLLGRRDAARAERFDGGDRRAQYRRATSAASSARPSSRPFRVAGRLGRRVRGRRRDLCRRGAPLAYDQPRTRRTEMTTLQPTINPGTAVSRLAGRDGSFRVERESRAARHPPQRAVQARPVPE